MHLPVRQFVRILVEHLAHHQCHVRSGRRAHELLGRGIRPRAGRLHRRVAPAGEQKTAEEHRYMAGGQPSRWRGFVVKGVAYLDVGLDRSGV